MGFQFGVKSNKQFTLSVSLDPNDQTVTVKEFLFEVFGN